MTLRIPRLSTAVALAATALCAFSPPASAWWDKSFTARQPLSINTGEGGTSIPGAVEEAVVLVRLHEGNFNFLAASEDGSDLRFVAADDETLLPFHVEKFDSLLNEAFVWVRVPEIVPDSTQEIWVYYGSQAGGPGGHDPAATFPDSTLLAYHFGGRSGTPPVDSTKNSNNAATSGITIEGSLIGSGIRLDGATSIRVPATDSLTWSGGADLTWSAWVKPVTLDGRAPVFHFANEGDVFELALVDGAPVVRVASGGTDTESAPGDALRVGAWQHVAVVATMGRIDLFVDGEAVASLDRGIPALGEELFLGGDGAEAFFDGEVEEMVISSVIQTPAEVLFSVLNQGPTEDALRLVSLGQPGAGKGHNETLEHMFLFVDIANNMMFDGWIAVGVCVLMIIFGWSVAFQKFAYLNSIQKGTTAFLKQWAHLSSDLTALEGMDKGQTQGMGSADEKMLHHVRRSPLFHLYQIGSEEISHRLGTDSSKGLTARSIQAIRAALESGLVRENQRMNKGIVMLTVSIAGGPYVGLLGTVVGVMITFALIAKTGEVEVNTIAPGIASALLATTAGLVVAIPALFMYSYLNQRIKDVLAAMQVFIDEFIAKMAEYYPPPNESPMRQIVGDQSDLLRSPGHPLHASTEVGNPMVPTGAAIPPMSDARHDYAAEQGATPDQSRKD